MGNKQKIFLGGSIVPDKKVLKKYSRNSYRNEKFYNMLQDSICIMKTLENKDEMYVSSLMYAARSLIVVLTEAGKIDNLYGIEICNSILEDSIDCADDKISVEEFRDKIIDICDRLVQSTITNDKASL